MQPNIFVIISSVLLNPVKTLYCHINTLFYKRVFCEGENREMSSATIPSFLCAYPHTTKHHSTFFLAKER